MGKVFANGRVMYLAKVIHVQTLYKTTLPHRHRHQATAAAPAAAYSTFRAVCALWYIIGTSTARNCANRSFVRSCVRFILFRATSP